MQTFFPLPDLPANAAALDGRRLNSQQNECKTLLKALTGQSTGYRQHTVTRMWEGHAHALCLYALACCAEAARRGHTTHRAEWFAELLPTLPDTGFPAWVGQPEVHAGYRALLLLKQPAWYERFGWSEPAEDTRIHFRVLELHQQLQGLAANA